MANDQQSSEDNDRPSKSEWVVAAIGAVLLLGCLGYLVTIGLSRSGGAPDISTLVQETTPVQNGYRVGIVAENIGDAAAASVVVEGTLTMSGGESEVSHTTFDYLPERSQRKGGLFFTNDPAGGELEVRPLGYVDP